MRAACNQLIGVSLSRQMTPAKYDSTTPTAEAGDFTPKASGRTLRFDG